MKKKFLKCSFFLIIFFITIGSKSIFAGQTHSSVKSYDLDDYLVSYVWERAENEGQAIKILEKKVREEGPWIIIEKEKIRFVGKSGSVKIKASLFCIAVLKDWGHLMHLLFNFLEDYSDNIVNKKIFLDLLEDIFWPCCFQGPIYLAMLFNRLDLFNLLLNKFDFQCVGHFKFISKELELQYSLFKSLLNMFVNESSTKDSWLKYFDFDEKIHSQYYYLLRYLINRRDENLCCFTTLI